MSLNGWEHYDLEKEIAVANVAQLLDLYKREDEKYSKKCGEYFTLQSSLTEEGKKRLEEECKFLEEATIKVALAIAKRLTDTKSSK